MKKDKYLSSSDFLLPTPKSVIGFSRTKTFQNLSSFLENRVDGFSLKNLDEEKVDKRLSNKKETSRGNMLEMEISAKILEDVVGEDIRTPSCSVSGEYHNYTISSEDSKIFVTDVVDKYEEVAAPIHLPIKYEQDHLEQVQHGRLIYVEGQPLSIKREEIVADKDELKEQNKEDILVDPKDSSAKNRGCCCLI